MMAQVDERLKRRFSVSASMEEISKIAEMKTIATQQNVGPEQAALAQSQHFDQLEALWNKRSPPPRRRLNKSLSRQTSLAEDRIDSSDEDEFLEERSGTCFQNHLRPITFPIGAMYRHHPRRRNSLEHHPTKGIILPSSLSLDSVDQEVYLNRDVLGSTPNLKLPHVPLIEPLPESIPVVEEFASASDTTKPKTAIKTQHESIEEVEEITLRNKNGNKKKKKVTRSCITQ